MLKAIEIGGTDMTDKPVEVRGNSSDAHVVLTDRITQLEGSVTRGSRPAPAVDVVVFPDEPAPWVFPARHVRTLRSNADGTFTTHGIPQHQSYLAVALDYLDDGETQARSSWRASATRPRGSASSTVRRGAWPCASWDGVDGRVQTTLKRQYSNQTRT